MSGPEKSRQTRQEGGGDDDDAAAGEGVEAERTASIWEMLGREASGIGGGTSSAGLGLLLKPSSRADLGFL